MTNIRRIIDMTPAERKAEALAILAKKNISYDGGMVRLDALTRFQVAGGYGADINLYNLQELLKLFDERRIAMSKTRNWKTGQTIWRFFIRGEKDVSGIHTSGKTLKIAILKAYWRMQPDEGEREVV